jgi:hypothetical protein
MLTQTTRGDGCKLQDQVDLKICMKNKIICNDVAVKKTNSNKMMALWAPVVTVFPILSDFI